MQLAVRYAGAARGTLASELADLVAKGELPPLMGEWAKEVRLL